MAVVAQSANYNQGVFASAILWVDAATITTLASATDALPAGHAAIAPLQAIGALLAEAQARSKPLASAIPGAAGGRTGA